MSAGITKSAILAEIEAISARLTGPGMNGVYDVGYALDCVAEWVSEQSEIDESLTRIVALDIARLAESERANRAESALFDVQRIIASSEWSGSGETCVRCGGSRDDGHRPMCPVERAIFEVMW